MISGDPQKPPLDDALRDFGHAMADALRLDRLLDWLASALPPWAERIPAPPRWLNLMFFVYVCVAMQAAFAVYLLVTEML